MITAVQVLLPGERASRVRREKGDSLEASTQGKQAVKGGRICSLNRLSRKGPENDNYAGLCARHGFEHSTRGHIKNKTF